MLFIALDRWRGQKYSSCIDINNEYLNLPIHKVCGGELLMCPGTWLGRYILWYADVSVYVLTGDTPSQFVAQQLLPLSNLPLPSPAPREGDVK